MRFLLIIFFVILCMAINIRIDGVWPPAAVNQHVDLTVRQVAEPAKAARLLLGELIPSGTETLQPSPIPEPGTLIRAMAVGHQTPDQAGRECS